MEKPLHDSSSIDVSGVAHRNYDSIHNGTSKKRRRSTPNNVFAAMKELIRGPQRLWTVLLFSIIATIGSALTGITLGYSSPAIPSINSSFANYAHKSMWTSTGESWFACLSNIGAIFGSFVAVFLADRAGRKDTLIFSNTPTVCGYLFITCASYYQNADDKFGLCLLLLYLGRFLTGVGAGWTSVVVPMYVVEISPALGKGLFGALNQLAITIGILGVEAFGIGNVLKYYHLSLLPMATVLLYILLAFILKETPRWLISKGRVKQSTAVMKILRGTLFEKELEQLQSSLNAEETDFRSKMSFMKTKPALLALLFSVLLMTFQQVCGPNAIIFFANDILIKGGDSQLTASIKSSIGIGVIQVIATAVAVIVIDIVGRKLLLFVGSIGAFVTLTVMGIYYLLVNVYSMDVTTYIPIVCITLFIISFSLGWAPIPWLMISELSPTKVRAIIAGVATAVNWSLAALVTGIFGIGVVQSHSYIAYWVFALMALLSFVFVLFLPETKGYSLQEIERKLANYKPFRCRARSRRARID